MLKVKKIYHALVRSGLTLNFSLFFPNFPPLSARWLSPYEASERPPGANHPIAAPLLITLSVFVLFHDFTSHQRNMYVFREYFSRANMARCRYRFPTPAILCKGKYVSRSATLSCLMEVIGKNILHNNEKSNVPAEIEVSFRIAGL